MIQKKNEILGTIMAVCGGICWGFSGCCGQFLFEAKGAKAPWLVSLRLLFAGLIMIAVGFSLHGRRNMDILKKKADTLRLLLFAFCGISLCQFTYFMAIEASNAGTATVLQYLSPVLILLVVCFREKRYPGWLELAAIFLSLLGTFVLGTHGNIHTFYITGNALFWGLAAAVSSVLYNMIPGSLILRYDIYQVLGFGMFFGGVLMCVLFRPWEYELIWDTETGAALISVIVIGTAVAFGLYLQGVSMIGPLKGSILASVEPLSAVIISVFWLGTSFAPADFLGFGMILGAVLMLTVAQGKMSDPI